MKTRWTIGVLGLAILLMLGYVWRTDRARSLAAELDRLHTEKAVLTDSLSRLQARTVQLQRVDRIKHIASTELGLVEPDEIPVLVPAIEPTTGADSTDIESGAGSGMTD